MGGDAQERRRSGRRGCYEELAARLGNPTMLWLILSSVGESFGLEPPDAWRQRPRRPRRSRRWLVPATCFAG